MTAVGKSEEFNISVGVHQGSALSPLLFITVMEEATKECKGTGPWELLYADDLVLTATSKQEAMNLFHNWKNGVEKRGLRVNESKTKILVTGKKPTELLKSGKWPCGCCGKGVGSNSVFCVCCKLWCHKKCSRLRSLQGIVNFRCPRCSEADVPSEEDVIKVGGSVLQEVQEFRYLGDMLDTQAGAERAERTRVAAARSK